MSDRASSRCELKCSIEGLLIPTNSTKSRVLAQSLDILNRYTDGSSMTLEAVHDATFSSIQSHCFSSTLLLHSMFTHICPILLIFRRRPKPGTCVTIRVHTSRPMTIPTPVLKALVVRATRVFPSTHAQSMYHLPI
jgi:hypothetical protein